jgi:hypothetical protein
MLIAPLKPNGLPRPVRIPDMFRAIQAMPLEKCSSPKRHSISWRLEPVALILDTLSADFLKMDALM